MKSAETEITKKLDEIFSNFFIITIMISKFPMIATVEATM